MALGLATRYSCGIAPRNGRSAPSAGEEAGHVERLILDGAARALTVDETASMQTIAEAAGVARLTLYRRFSSREMLIAALTDEMLGLMGEAATEALEAPGTGADVLGALLVQLAEISARYPPILGPKPGAPTSAALRFRRDFTTVVERGKADGSIAADVDPIALRQVALGGMGALLRCAADHERDATHPGVVLAEIVLRGARPR